MASFWRFCFFFVTENSCVLLSYIHAHVYRRFSALLYTITVGINLLCALYLVGMKHHSTFSFKSLVKSNCLRIVMPVGHWARGPVKCIQSLRVQCIFNLQVKFWNWMPRWLNLQSFNTQDFATVPPCTKVRRVMILSMFFGYMVRKVKHAHLQHNLSVPFSYITFHW